MTDAITDSLFHQISQKKSINITLLRKKPLKVREISLYPRGIEGCASFDPFWEGRFIIGMSRD